MITNKFDYKALKKESVDGKRLYSCPDGNAVASVTTILDRTKDKTLSLIHISEPTRPY